MSKETNKMGIWILVDALLLLAIVVIIAFVIGQARINNRNSESVNTPTPKPTASATETPIPTPTDEPTPTPTEVPTEAPTEAPTETPTPTEEPTPTPDPNSITANATVVANQLNVRKGPGTTYDKLYDDTGTNVMLSNGERVQIIDESSDGWYHIYVIHKGVKYEGYVYSNGGQYVKKDA